MQEKIEKLIEDQQQGSIKLEELTQLRFKLLGAIEILESMENESDEEKVEDGSDKQHNNQD